MIVNILIMYKLHFANIFINSIYLIICAMYNMSAVVPSILNMCVHHCICQIYYMLYHINDLVNSIAGNKSYQCIF